MTTEILHPAILLGQWIRTKRRENNLVASRVANEVGLTPSQFAEIEAGVGNWVTESVKKKLFFAIRLCPEDSSTLNELVAEAAASNPLEFNEVFTREQLMPMRLRTSDDSQVTLDDKDRILDLVFAPLKSA